MRGSDPDSRDPDSRLAVGPGWMTKLQPPNPLAANRNNRKRF